ARLELLEYYLAHHEDLSRCASASLEWLARHIGIKRSVCLAVDAESSMLVGIAGYGVPTEDVEVFSYPLADGHDPLVATIGQPQPTHFRTMRVNGDPSRAIPITPLGPGPFTAVP